MSFSRNSCSRTAYSWNQSRPPTSSATRSMVTAAGVANVNGTPKALAARANGSSAPARPALMPPVGAIANGSAASPPNSWTFMSTAATFTSTLGSRRTRSKAFPSQPLRLVVPFPPAGAVDIASRATAHEMQRILGHPVAVENKPGAGGNLGVLDLARSAPDGYSMVMSTSGIQAINPALYAKMPLDPNKELAPVAPLVSLNNVLVVHPSVPARSVKEVIALA